MCDLDLFEPLESLAYDGSNAAGVASAVVAKLGERRRVANDVSGAGGMSLLYKACCGGAGGAPMEKLVSLLIERGADVDGRVDGAETGDRPLVAALRAGTLGMYKALLNAGAQLEFSRAASGSGQRFLDMVRVCGRADFIAATPGLASAASTRDDDSDFECY